MTGASIKVRLTGLQDSKENVVEFNNKISKGLREIGFMAMQDWRALNMAAVLYGKVPNKTTAAEFGGDVPGSDYIRREAAREVHSKSGFSKGQRFEDNRGKYGERKRNGWLKVRGTRIGPSSYALGRWTGGLFNGVASASYKCTVGSKHGINMEMRLDTPGYFSVVHDGNQNQNIASRPFVEVNWDLFIKQDLWVRINRLMKASLNIWVSPPLYKFWMDTGYVAESYGFE